MHTSRRVSFHDCRIPFLDVVREDGKVYADDLYEKFESKVSF